MFDPIHIDMKELRIVDIEVGIGRTLNVMFFQSESFCESFG